MSISISRSTLELFDCTRWNCFWTGFVPWWVDGIMKNVSNIVVDLANRETALAHAMFSAGITYAVSRACKQGLLKACSCSRSSRPKNLPRDWSWGGWVNDICEVISIDCFIVVVIMWITVIALVKILLIHLRRKSIRWIRTVHWLVSIARASLEDEEEFIVVDKFDVRWIYIIMKLVDE